MIVNNVAQIFIFSPIKKFDGILLYCTPHFVIYLRDPADMYSDPFISESPIRVSYRRAAFITLITLVVSQLGTAAAVLVIDFPPGVLEEVIVVWFAVAAIVSTVVAFPLAIFFQRERLKLAEAMRQLQQAHDELARRARVDPLTSVLNRETFFNEIESREARNVTGAILMIDVDHFKSINDTYGHQAGDEALKLVALTIRASVRDCDLVARIGGEEFGAFIASDTADLAADIAERIRHDISRIKFHPGHGIARRITASIGVAPASHATEFRELLRRADRSMYDAKDAGRNRVEVHAAA